jgi:hypothetical protein
VENFRENVAGNNQDLMDTGENHVAKYYVKSSGIFREKVAGIKMPSSRTSWIQVKKNM